MDAPISTSETTHEIIYLSAAEVFPAHMLGISLINYQAVLSKAEKLNPEGVPPN